MVLKAEELENRIQSGIPGAKVKASDLTGGGDHWQVSVEAAQFEGLSLVKQHQLIYKALGELMHKEIHALAIAVSTPKNSN